MACIFCQIIAGAIPATIVYSSADVTAMRDINPQAPTHVLVVPNRHIESIADLGPADGPLLGRLFEVIDDVARGEGLSDRGYRVVANTGTDAGQTVNHVHFHVLGGRPLAWPPG
jgi:histidine triad (HIT) family protein